MNINIYNPYVRQEFELYHHGVAGQKWGKKNGPPYPLAASAHSASEKKARWRKSLNSGGASAKRTKSARSKNKSVVDALKRKFDSITPEQKAKAKKIVKTALIVAGAIAVTALAGYGAYHGVKALKAYQYAKISKDYHKAIKEYYNSKKSWDTIHDSFKTAIESDRPITNKTAKDIINNGWWDYLKKRHNLDVARRAWASSRGVKLNRPRPRAINVSPFLY